MELFNVLISERYARILVSRFLVDFSLTVDDLVFEDLVEAVLTNNGDLKNEEYFKIISRGGLEWEGDHIGALKEV